MVVVLIMGILATIGISSFRKHLDTSQNAEGLATIRAISAAQESYRATHQVYLNTAANPLDLTAPNYYPTSVPDGTKYEFFGHPGEGLWRRLAPDVPALTSYGFVVAAGLPSGTTWPNLALTQTPTWPAATPADYPEPWYVIKAIGDNNGDGTLNVLLATSFNDRIYQEGYGE